MLPIDQELTNFEYKILKVLGQGGSSQVYLVENKEKKLFAMKEFDKAKLTDNYFVELLKQEIEIMNKLQKLNNNHIVKFYKFLKTKTHYYMIMEYCKDGNLEEYIQKNNIPEKKAVEILMQLLLGFKALHQENIVHRDIKAENILIHDNIYKLADFGFSKQNTMDLSNLKISAVIGTPAYISPEIIETNITKYNAKIDIWGIGVLFFYMIFKKFPFYYEGWGVPSPSFQKKVMFGVKNKKQYEIAVKNLIIFLEDKKVKGNISVETFDLFCKMFKVNASERINWTDLYNHKLFSKYAYKDDEDDEFADEEIPGETKEDINIISDKYKFKNHQNNLFNEWSTKKNEISNFYKDFQNREIIASPNKEDSKKPKKAMPIFQNTYSQYYSLIKYYSYIKDSYMIILRTKLEMQSESVSCFHDNLLYFVMLNFLNWKFERFNKDIKNKKNSLFFDENKFKKFISSSEYEELINEIDKIYLIIKYKFSEIDVVAENNFNQDRKYIKSLNNDKDITEAYTNILQQYRTKINKSIEQKIQENGKNLKTFYFISFLLLLCIDFRKCIDFKEYKDIDWIINHYRNMSEENLKKEIELLQKK